MDICCMTNCSKTASTAERLKALRAIMAKDDTHFLEDGYKNLAVRCMNCLRQLSEDSKRTVKKSVTYFWRGFKSPCGATTPRLAAGPPSASRGITFRGNAGGGGERVVPGTSGPIISHLPKMVTHLVYIVLKCISELILWYVIVTVTVMSLARSVRFTRKTTRALVQCRVTYLNLDCRRCKNIFVVVATISFMYNMLMCIPECIVIHLWCKSFYQKVNKSIKEKKTYSPLIVTVN